MVPFRIRKGVMVRWAPLPSLKNLSLKKGQTQCWKLPHKVGSGE
uniref:Uncharacterized protein n=1 Tax=Arundo donax TaxID=35708 RepID=A0A0A9HTD1_ARUDO